MSWTFIGEGNYQIAFINPERTRVLKIRKTTPEDRDYEYDAPERSVRLWNQINPDLKEPARTVRHVNGKLAWTCPYVTGRAATDKEIQDLLIAIYAKHQRIIPDAISPGNVITTDEQKTICIDIGAALRLGSKKHPEHGSPTSQAFWTNLRAEYLDFFKLDCFKRRPLSIATIKALFYINAENIPFSRDFYGQINTYASYFDDPMRARISGRHSPAIRNAVIHTSPRFFRASAPPAPVPVRPWLQMLHAFPNPFLMIQQGCKAFIQLLLSLYQSMCLNWFQEPRPSSMR